METRWRGSLQLLIGLGLTVLFFYMMAPFMVTILLGAVVAILIYPVYQSLCRKLPRALAAFVVMIATVLGFLLPLAFVLYNGIYKLFIFISGLKIMRGGGMQFDFYSVPWIGNSLHWVGRFVPVDKEWLEAQLLEVAQTLIERATALITGVLSGMPGLLLSFTVVLLAGFFFLLDGERFLRFLALLSPMKPARSLELYSTFENSCRGVVLGLLASALVQSVLMMFFFVITGIPNAFLFGSVTFVTAMVPVVGSIPVAIGGIVYLFMVGSPGKAIVMIVGAILIGLSDNVVRPIIMKGQSQMHPLLALVSVFGALQLVGPTGIFLGPIIAAVFVSFLKITSEDLRSTSQP